MTAHLYDFEGEMITSAEIARRANLPVRLIRSRLMRNKTGHALIERPVSLAEAARRGMAHWDGERKLGEKAMSKSKTYEVSGRTGTPKELYDWIMAGVDNPPSYEAFRTRLNRKDRTLADLQRSKGKLSERGMKQKKVAGEKIKKLIKERAMAATPTQRRPELPQLQTWTPKKTNRFFRAGSLKGWPDLEQAAAKGLL